MKTIEYFYSTRSVFAYLGAERIVALARRFGRRLIHRPIDLARLMEGIGGTPFDRRTEAQRRYHFGREIERWGEYLGLPVLVDPVHHYGDRALPSGFVIAAQRLGADADRLHAAVLAALWRDDRDIADREVLADLARAAGIDPAPLLAAALAPETQAEFASNTADAIARGVLGSPTYIVDGDMFYGQDRLMMVERALERPFAPPSGRTAL
ncbi:MAG: 2-hydroxychromene-2-carboxylate isomerase [Candidatus Odyssella sp.]|nr:2-hydroxychromene-2-carboxylate isomerase [Candidatus Odyssella sp.]